MKANLFFISVTVIDQVWNDMNIFCRNSGCVIPEENFTSDYHHDVIMYVAISVCMQLSLHVTISVYDFTGRRGGTQGVVTGPYHLPSHGAPERQH